MKPWYISVLIDDEYDKWNGRYIIGLNSCPEIEILMVSFEKKEDADIVARAMTVSYDRGFNIAFRQIDKE